MPISSSCIGRSRRVQILMSCISQSRRIGCTPSRAGRKRRRSLPTRAKELFEKDAELSRQYNKDLAGGKWSHMADQTHIGYTMWQQPDKNVMPKVEEIELPVAAEMGVAIEGSDKWWPNEKGDAKLPAFDYLPEADTIDRSV